MTELVSEKPDHWSEVRTVTVNSHTAYPNCIYTNACAVGLIWNPPIDGFGFVAVASTLSLLF
jgi:hypothetical protein